MSNKNPKVDEYILQSTIWKDEMTALRDILLSSGLSEEIKWGKPCYIAQGKNIAIIQAFKSYFALLFFEGYRLKDTQGVLVKMGEETKTGRQIRFADVDEIKKLESTLLEYIQEAVELIKK